MPRKKKLRNRSDGGERGYFPSLNFLLACACVAVSLAIAGRLRLTTNFDLDSQLLRYRDDLGDNGEFDRALAWCSRIWDEKTGQLVESNLERLDRDNGDAMTTIANLMVRAAEAHLRSTSSLHSPPGDKYADVMTAAARLLRRAAGLHHHHGAHYSLALLLKLYPTIVAQEGEDPAKVGAAHMCASQRATIRNLDREVMRRCSDVELVYDWKGVAERRQGVAVLGDGNTPFVVQGMDAIVHNIPTGDDGEKGKCQVYLGESGCYPALWRQFSRDQRRARVEKAALVDGFSAGSYYHWLFEALPKLLILADDDKTRQIPILLPGLASSKSFIEQTLQMLPKQNIFERNNMHFRDAQLTVVADALYVPIVTPLKDDQRDGSQRYGSSRTFVPTRETIEKVRNELFVRKERLDALVLVVRSGRETRRLGNEHAVVAALATVANDNNLRLDVFDGSNKTMGETREIFGAARLIVGVHGAGLANAFVFSDPERAALLELALPEPEFSEYRLMSSALNFRYLAVPLPHSTFEATAWPRPTRVVSGAQSLL